MHYSRKQRRDIERKLGLLNIGNKSKEEQAEIAERRKAFGQASHRKFLQDTENKIREQDAENEAKQYASLVETHGKEKADQIIQKWRAREERKRRKK